MSRTTIRSISAAACLLLCAGQGAVAHDVWLHWQPARVDRSPTTSVAAGERVDVRLLVGHGEGEPEPVARNEHLLDRFVAIAPDGRRMPLAGLHGVDPAGVFRPDVPGPWSVIYVGKPVANHLPADAFEAYLEEEGLDRILAARREQGAGAAGRPGRELFSRSLQAVLWVSGPDGVGTVGGDMGGDSRVAPAMGAMTLVGDEAADLPVRFTLRRGRGGVARLTLLADGRPVPEALVDLRLGGRLVTSLRTDSEGSLRARLEAGDWVATAVVLRATDDPRADWRSIFAALSFAWPRGVVVAAR